MAITHSAVSFIRANIPERPHFLFPSPNLLSIVLRSQVSCFSICFSAFFKVLFGEGLPSLGLLKRIPYFLQ